MNGKYPDSPIALAKQGQKGYNIPDGADFRCVGGRLTCAGTEELALLSTAVILFDSIISCGRTHINVVSLPYFYAFFVQICADTQK